VSRPTRIATLRHLFALQGPAHTFGSHKPAEIDTGACGKQQVDLACNGEQGETHSDGTRGLGKSTPWGFANTLGVS
jgi:hypothetical protein